jgi:PfaB family protein
LTSLKAISSLAIIGMDAALSGGEGLGFFGRSVYRGLPLTGPSGAQPALQSAQRALRDAVVAAGQARVICLSPGLAEVGAGRTDLLDCSAAANPLTSALASAADALHAGDADACLLVGDQPACAMVLTTRNFALDNARRIYAVIEGSAQADGVLTADTVSSVFRQAADSAGVQPGQVGLIETTSLSSGELNLAEARGLLAVYPSAGQPTCALSGGCAGLLGLIKTAWCLFQRVIPCTPGWNGPAEPEMWQGAPFYVACESRGWFNPTGQSLRFAALNTHPAGGGFSQVLLKEELLRAPWAGGALRQEPFYLFPLAAASVADLTARLADLRNRLGAAPDMASAAQHAYRQYLQDQPGTTYTACILGHSPEELGREIGFALTGIPAAFEKQADWQTPLGSYFASQPLGETGGVAFVYPGAFNSYPGVGRDLFYLFPYLFDRMAAVTERMGEQLNQTLLYPRSMAAPTPADLVTIENRLNADPLAMLISGTSLALLYTYLLRESFGIHPTSALGYSLGEISMMFAAGVWTQGDETSATLRASPLFHTRLAGPQNAVREYWNLPALNGHTPSSPLWGNYVLMAAPDKVREAMSAEPRVYLTHINTPRQVVIGGDPDSCRRVIDALKCTSLQAPFDYVLHCDPMHSEYNELVRLHSWPVAGQTEMALYSAANFQPLPMDSQAAAEQIAHDLCTCLDFPRLVGQVYAGGARIFIELGAGSNCARWVDESLKDQPHAAFSVNRKGVDDHTSILRLLARLVSHRVPVNLNLIYPE